MKVLQTIVTAFRDFPPDLRCSRWWSAGRNSGLLGRPAEEFAERGWVLLQSGDGDLTTVSAKHAHPRAAVTAVPTVHFDNRRVGPTGLVFLRHARRSEPMLLERDSFGGDPSAKTLGERA